MAYLIVGASSDMGRELIKCIDKNEDGAVIYAHYNRGRDRLEKLSGELKSSTKMHLVQADLSLNDGAMQLVKGLESSGLSVINKLVFMPAYPFDYMRLKELDVDKLKQEMQISAYSFLEIAKELVPVMKKAENPVILAMLTKYVTDELPPKFMTDYVVSKYALLGAVKSIKVEYGSKIRVEYLAPDMVDTAFLSNIDPRIVEMNREVNGLLKASDVAMDMYSLLTKDDN